MNAAVQAKQFESEAGSGEFHPYVEVDAETWDSWRHDNPGVVCAEIGIYAGLTVARYRDESHEVRAIRVLGDKGLRAIRLMERR